MAFDLYLIRHGESVNNAAPEPDRVEDPRLTERGEFQARALAARFDPGSLTVLLTSGFLRAVQTTQPMASRLNLRPKIWTDLHEVGGCYAGYIPGKEVGRPGMNRDTLRRDYPEFELPPDIDHDGWWKSRPYETWEQARVRAESQLKRLVAEFQGSGAKVACVIHADFKALLLEQILSDQVSFPTDLHNTGITHVRFEHAQFELLDFNNTEHLETD